LTLRRFHKTIRPRDARLGWYKGRTRHVCARSVPIAQIPDYWSDKKAAIDAGVGVAVDLGGVPSYRTVLTGFIVDCEARVTTRKPRPMEQRTLDNYANDLNAFGAFRFRGVAVADMPIDLIGPEVFSAYARKFGAWKASGFDSIVSRIGALFRWAVEMEYIDRYRPGPKLQRPGKQAIRDERIDLSKTFEPAEFVKLYLAGNQRCAAGSGWVCARRSSIPTSPTSRASALTSRPASWTSADERRGRFAASVRCPRM
jgi:hypothetical protein